MLIADQWLRDIPQQFLGKKRIEVLIRAFARQMQELWQVFSDLAEKTDLDTAEGQNLDYVGTIVPLTRKEAGELAGIGVTEPVISDERYRLFLRYQLLRNTCEGTYYDLIDGIELMWGYTGIHYMEEPDHPATIIFQTDRMDLDEEDLVEFHPELCIRAGGVGVVLRKYYGCSYEIPVEFAESILFRTSFYPRFNLPRLCLNGSWRLDGTRRLSGYDSQETVDLYPVCSGFKTEASGTPEEDTQLRLQTSVGEGTAPGSQTVLSAMYSVAWGMESGQGITLSSSVAESLGENTEFRLGYRVRERTENRTALSIAAAAECGAALAGKARVRASVLSAVGAGDITVYNRNCVDGTFKLNGSRKLNGGTELR